MNRKYHALLIVALALPLAGCWKEQQQVFAKCNAAIPYTGKDPPLARIETPLTRRMENAGYNIDYDAPHCVGAALPRRSPYCYSPKGFFAGIGYRMEMFNVSGPKAAGDAAVVAICDFQRRPN